MDNYAQAMYICGMTESNNEVTTPSIEISLKDQQRANQLVADYDFNKVIEQVAAHGLELIFDRMSKEEINQLRRKNPFERKLFARLHNLSIKDTDFILAMSEPSRLTLTEEGLVSPTSQPAPAAKTITLDPLRPKWFVTAWLLGVSWGQLAYFHGIASQTVMASANKVMRKEDRQANRIGNTTVSTAKLAELRQIFASQDWPDAGPVEIAQQLLLYLI